MTEEGRLRKEALDIVSHLDIMDLLKGYGHAEIVGSVALDLIVKRDIDIHSVILVHDLMRVAQHLVSVLIDIKGVREVRVTDHREKNAIKLAIDEFPGESGPWSIDIWLTTDEKTAGFSLIDSLSEKLDTEKRESILKIKRHYHIRGLLQNGLSDLIYTAVAEDGIKDVRQFELWLSQT
ncbi:MAG: hypothetical protein ACFE7R_10225, partial [Candidatus Hodarchaeota archaeon]